MRLLAVVALIIISSLTAQTRPDLSGRWTSEPVPAATQGQRGEQGARPDLGSGWGSTITITQDARQLSVEYAFFTRGDMQPPLKFIYALDGTRVAQPGDDGARDADRDVRRPRGTARRSSSRRTHDFKDPATGKAGSIDVRAAALARVARRRSSSKRRAAASLGGPPSTTRVGLPPVGRAAAALQRAARTGPARSAARADSARSSP